MHAGGRPAFLFETPASGGLLTIGVQDRARRTALILRGASARLAGWPRRRCRPPL